MREMEQSQSEEAQMTKHEEKLSEIERKLRLVDSAVTFYGCYRPSLFRNHKLREWRGFLRIIERDFAPFKR